MRKTLRKGAFTVIEKQGGSASEIYGLEAQIVLNEYNMSSRTKKWISWKGKVVAMIVEQVLNKL